MAATTAERTIEAQIRSASKIEPSRLPRLRLLGDAWAAAAVSAFGEFCASPVAGECTGVSSLSLGSGAPETKDVAICMMLKSTKWQDVGFVLGDAITADLFAEAIFGGTGKSTGPQAAAGVPRRPMTALDRHMAQKGLAVFLEAANPVFEPIVPLGIQPDLCITASVAEELDELLAADNRSFLVLAFKFQIGGLVTTLRAALPEKVLATHRRKLATIPERPSPVMDETWAKNIQEGLQLADLEVRALLDERQITLGEVAHFAVGQTIVLDATMESLIVVECEGQRLFRGHMGMTRDAYVVRIEEKIDPTEEFIDDILAD